MFGRATGRLGDRLQLTFDRLPVGIAHVSARGDWQLVNATLCQQLGLGLAELEHKRLEDLLEVDLHDADAGPKECQYARPNGQIVWLRVTISRAHDFYADDGDGDEPYYVVILEDVSANKASERTLGIAAHELRLPLSHVKGFVSTLRRTDVDWDADTRSDFLAEAEREVDRLDGLIDELLDQASGGTRPHPHRTTIHPCALVLTTIARLRPMIGEREVRVDVPADLPLVQVEIPAMERVLANLVLNAVTYSPAVTPVDIVGRLVDEYLELSIEDRGPGVPRREAERIFEPFYRGRVGAHRSQPGHGLGLAICRSIVTAHGGRIWVEPRSGGGARFIVALPVVHHHTPRRQLAHQGVPACAAQTTHHYSPTPGARPLQTPT